MARATRADVAKAAGVSLATVSHVMNGRAEELGFAPDTAERVRAAAAAVGYVPRALARSFRYQSSKVIALFFPELPSSLRLPVFNEMLTGCLEAAREARYFVLPVPVGADSRASVEETLKEIELAGAVCRAAESMEAAAHLLHLSDIPTAWVATGQRASKRSDCASFGVDEAQGVHDMLEHIDTASVRRPALLTGPGSRGDRASTFLAHFPQALVVETSGWQVTDGAQAAPQMLDAGADLIFAANDYLALGVLEEMRARRIRPATDIQLFGFGDTESGPAALSGISSIRWPVAELGYQAVQAVIQPGQSGGMHSQTSLPTHARPRRTTRPSRARQCSDHCCDPKATPSVS